MSDLIKIMVTVIKKNQVMVHRLKEAKQEESLSGNTRISLGERNRRDFIGGLMEGGNGIRQDQGERWRKY